MRAGRRSGNFFFKGKCYTTQLLSHVDLCGEGGMPSKIVGDLDVAYMDAGREDHPAVLLLHGWPDDASTWDHVVVR